MISGKIFQIPFFKRETANIFGPEGIGFGIIYFSLFRFYHDRSSLIQVALEFIQPLKRYFIHAKADDPLGDGIRCRNNSGIRFSFDRITSIAF